MADMALALTRACLSGIVTGAVVGLAGRFPAVAALWRVQLLPFCFGIVRVGGKGTDIDELLIYFLNLIEIAHDILLRRSFGSVGAWAGG